MTYKLKFLPAALKEWQKLNPTLKESFKKQLRKRLLQPHHANDKLKGALGHCYKIKLRSVGYRLVYHVNDDDITIIVIAVGKRNKSIVYLKAADRIESEDNMV